MVFIRNKEDFICDHCNAEVIGSGYTNHCPECLWSRHVDVEPGDRAEKCGGAMQPIRIEGSSPDYRLVHRCERCGIERRVTLSPADSTETIVRLAREAADS